jgi:hypothetical protein
MILPICAPRDLVMGLPDPRQRIDGVDLCPSSGQTMRRRLGAISLDVATGPEIRRWPGAGCVPQAYLSMKTELGTAALLDRSGKRAYATPARVHHADIPSNSLLLLRDVV